MMSYSIHYSALTIESYLFFHGEFFLQETCENKDESACQQFCSVMKLAVFGFQENVCGKTQFSLSYCGRVVN